MSISEQRQSPQAGANKRRRILYSCIDCRNRKVKCDRTYPSCLICQKRGYADTCRYLHDNQAESEHRQSPGTSTGLQGTPISQPEEAGAWKIPSNTPNTLQASGNAARIGVLSPQDSIANPQEEIDRLKSRIAELEAHTKSAASASSDRGDLAPDGRCYPTPSSTVAAVQTDKNPLYDLDPMESQSSSFKTQYVGPSASFSIMKEFPGLPAFVQNVMKHFPSLDHTKHSFERFKVIRSVQPLPQGGSHDTSSLLALIPDRSTTDALVAQYLDLFETTYRVLHIPSFLRDYQDLWRSPNESSPEFLVTLLLAMASIVCVSGRYPMKFLGLSSRGREAATEWIAASKAYLAAQSQKTVTLATFQIEILVMLAEEMNSLSLKAQWVSSGHLLRLAMAAGLHREPRGLSPRISTFDQEMRRRLWATILELELLIAVIRGMPSAIRTDAWDCEPPSNIDDEDFGVASLELPPSKPVSVYTKTSFLCTAQQNVALRLDLLTHINAVKSSLGFEQVLQYDAQLRQGLDELPDWQSVQGAQLAHAFARSQLEEFLILIHQPFAVQSDHQSRFFYSRAACRDAAISTLSSYNSFVAPFDMFSCFFRSDDLKASLRICHDLVTGRHTSSSLAYNKSDVLDMMEKALSRLGDRVMHLGQGVNSYWNVTIALGLAYSKLSPGEPADLYAQQAAARVIKLHDRIVALQDSGRDEGTRSSVGENPVPNVREVPSTYVGGGTQGTGQSLSSLNSFDEADLGLQDFDMGDIWNLDTFLGFEWSTN
jgi:hypothetical protein